MKEKELLKMSNMNIKRLSLSMSLPMILSMISLAMYNLVDSIFVSKISVDALNAISFSSPIQLIMIAVALGTGVGINSLLSRKLGEKKYEDAGKVISNGIFLIIISWLLFAVFGLFFTKIFFSYFTSNLEVIKLGKQYLSICTIFSFGMFMQIAFEKIMEALGKPVYSMVVQFSGAVINLILDPILIFGLGIIPRMGIVGAGIATVTGQIIGMIIGIILFKKSNLDINFKNIFNCDFKIIKKIYSVGFPTIILESVSAFVCLILNKILGVISIVSIPIWLIYNKIQSFIFMIVYGLNNGMIPIVGYNYGSKNNKRVNDTISFFLKLATIVMIFGMIIFMFFTKPLLLLFDATPDMLIIGIPALRILSLGFVFAGISIILSGEFQAVGKGKNSLIVFLTRQLIVTIPLVLLINYTLGYKYIWWAFVISEFIAMVYAIIIHKKIRR